jgi:serine/threonine protein kinase
MCTNPWESRWELFGGSVGQGGQGVAQRVRDKAQRNLEGVLKTLKKGKERDLKARSRMHREATNLAIVAENGGSVPRLLDPGNTAQFADVEAPLYFVMEFIPGETLADFIKRNGPLPPENGIAFATSLCKTVAIGHEFRVLHRDIKPKNVIVRDPDANDLMIVDYGLSFNEDVETDAEATDPNETIGNRFTALPERMTPDAQRRPESDLAAICGILYYIITRHQPAPIRDAHGNPPHRRQGKTIRDTWPDYPHLNALDALLDRGLEHDVDDRFSTASELLARLGGVEARGNAESVEDISQFLAHSSERLHRQSRRALLLEFNATSQKVISEMEVYFAETFRPGRFRARVARLPMSTLRDHIAEATLPEDVDDVDAGIMVMIHVPRLDAWRVLLYAIVSKGSSALSWNAD